MILTSRAVGLLCLLLVVNAAYEPDFSKTYVAVKNKAQLWRYLVGPSGDEYGVTPGDDYVCLMDWRGKFVRGTPHGPYNDRKDCRDSERFIVEFLDDNLVSLRRKDGNYLTCAYPKAGTSSSLIEEAKLILYITEDEDELYLYSPLHKKLFGAFYPTSC